MANTLLTEKEVNLVNLIAESGQGRFTNSDCSTMIASVHDYLFESSLGIDTYIGSARDVPDGYKKCIDAIVDGLRPDPEVIMTNLGLPLEIKAAMIYPSGFGTYAEHAGKYLPPHKMNTTGETRGLILQTLWNMMSYYGLIYAITINQTLIMPPLPDYSLHLLNKLHTQWCPSEWGSDPATQLLVLQEHLQYGQLTKIVNFSHQVSEVFAELHAKVIEVEGRGKETIMMTNPYSWA